MRQRVYFIGIRSDLGKNIDDFKWPKTIEKPKLKQYLIDNNVATSERLDLLAYYLKNETNGGRYSISEMVFYM